MHHSSPLEPPSPTFARLGPPKTPIHRPTHVYPHTYSLFIAMCIHLSPLTYVLITYCVSTCVHPQWITASRHPLIDYHVHPRLSLGTSLAGRVSRWARPSRRTRDPRAERETLAQVVETGMVAYRPIVKTRGNRLDSRPEWWPKRSTNAHERVANHVANDGRTHGEPQSKPRS